MYLERSNKAKRLGAMTGLKRAGSKVGPPGGRYVKRSKAPAQPKAKPKENKRARAYA